MRWKKQENSKTLRLYVQEHLWFLISVVMICPLAGVLMAYLDNNWNYLYLVILFAAVSLTGFSIHYYKSYALYKKLTEELESAEEFFIEGRSALSKAQKAYQKRISRIYYRDIGKLQDDKKNYQLLMNQWVHQMKTPVSVIRMVSENHPGDTEFARVQAETVRLEYGLNQILNMMRMEKAGQDFEIGKVSLSKLVKNTVNEGKNYFIEKSVYPKVEIDPDLMVYTDPKWFCFALAQIVNNAVKYSSEGKYVWLESKREHEKIILTVRDEGCGILPEETGRIFNLFYTGTNGRKHCSESTGLGLYIAKTVLGYLGHAVKVKSVPQEGTEFEIWFDGR